MERENEIDYLSLKNFYNFLIDLGINVSTNDQIEDSIKIDSKKKFTSVSEVDIFLKNFQNICKNTIKTAKKNRPEIQAQTTSAETLVFLRIFKPSGPTDFSRYPTLVWHQNSQQGFCTFWG